MTLAERLRAATGPDRKLFEDAWEEIHGPRPNNLITPEDEMRSWFEKFRPFHQMLDAKAWTSAAEMLVPEGWFWSITMRGEKRGGFHACCVREGPLEWHEAATPAIALLLAICQAKGIE